MFDNIIAKIEELLNRFGEGIVGEKIAKHVYINEGYKEDKGIVKRKELEEMHYFSSIKEKPEDFWSRISEYIEEHFETEKIQRHI